jgi:hypothetical protein
VISSRLSKAPLYSSSGKQPEVRTGLVFGWLAGLVDLVDLVDAVVDQSVC